MQYLKNHDVEIDSRTLDRDTVELQVIINPELENKLLSYGEHIEVLSPKSLRNTIHKRREGLTFVAQ